MTDCTPAVGGRLSPVAHVSSVGVSPPPPPHPRSRVFSENGNAMLYLVRPPLFDGSAYDTCLHNLPTA